MTKKELIAKCNSLVRTVARKQLAIEDLRKKKGVPNTACAECKVKDQVYQDKLTCVFDEAVNEEEKYRGEIEDLEKQKEKLKKDNVALQNEKNET